MISRIRAGWRNLKAADADFAKSREAVHAVSSTRFFNVAAPAAEKEPTVKMPVHITPTSNGYIIQMEVPGGQVPAPDATIVVEAAGKNADDVAHAVGAAVVTLSEKLATK